MKKDKAQKSFTEVFPNSSFQYLKHNHYRLYNLYNRVRKVYYTLNPPNDLIDFSKLSPNDVPAVICNHNRLGSLKKLIAFLKAQTLAVSIIIIDNKSNYQPLLKYYDELDDPKIQVIRFEVNHGIRVILPVCQTLKNYPYYFVSDADLVPFEDSPTDFLAYMIALLDKYPKFNHVGSSLEIKDLPDHFPMKEKVQKWEQRFWEKTVEPNVYDAHVDTTFSMYRRSSVVMDIYPSLRTGRPYTMKHLDWYIDPKNLDDEMIHYFDTITPHSTWLTKMKEEVKQIKAKPVLSRNR